MKETTLNSNCIEKGKSTLNSMAELREPLQLEKGNIETDIAVSDRVVAPMGRRVLKKCKRKKGRWLQRPAFLEGTFYLYL